MFTKITSIYIETNSYIDFIFNSEKAEFYFKVLEIANIQLE